MLDLQELFTSVWLWVFSKNSPFYVMQKNNLSTWGILMKTELVNIIWPILVVEGPPRSKRPQSNLRDTAVKLMFDIRLCNHALDLTEHAGWATCVHTYSRALGKKQSCLQSIRRWCTSVVPLQPSAFISACFWQTCWSVRRQGWISLDFFC